MDEWINNPMVQAAKNAMTPEQIEEYKRIGEYMYNNYDYKTAVEGRPPPKDTDYLVYAEAALRSGANPLDLSQEELKSLYSHYGQKWYEHFGISEEEVAELVKPKFSVAEMNEQAKKLKIPRQQRRMLERKLIKEQHKQKTKK